MAFPKIKNDVLNQPEIHAHKKISKKIKTEKEKNKAPFLIIIGRKDKILFTKYLAVMLDAGIPLQESLKSLYDQFKSSSLRYIINQAVNDLSNGLPLGESLAKFPKIFNSFFLNIISIGETSGSLPSSLKYLTAEQEKTEDLTGKIRNALVYPAVVFAGAVGIGIYLAFFLLPKLLPLFKSLKIQLPLTTRILLALTDWLASFWFITIAGLAVIALIAAVLIRVKSVKFLLQRIVISIPIFGTLSRDTQISQFSRILGTLLASGVKIVPALRITSDSVSNLVYQKELLIISSLVERGETIGAELKKHPGLFSLSAASIVSVGERTGKLSESLLSLADFTEKEVDNITKNLTTLIEPLILILVGVIVGFVALSIVTPIYQLTQGLSG